MIHLSAVRQEGLDTNGFAGLALSFAKADELHANLVCPKQKEFCFVKYLSPDT